MWQLRGAEQLLWGHYNLHGHLDEKKRPLAQYQTQSAAKKAVEQQKITAGMLLLLFFSPRPILCARPLAQIVY